MGALRVQVFLGSGKIVLDASDWIAVILAVGLVAAVILGVCLVL